MLENFHVKNFGKLLDVINVIYGFTLNAIKIILKLTIPPERELCLVLYNLLNNKSRLT